MTEDLEGRPDWIAALDDEWETAVRDAWAGAGATVIDWYCPTLLALGATSNPVDAWVAADIGLGLMTMRRDMDGP